MKRMQDKSKLYNIHAKAPTPPQTKANHKLPPQTKPYGWQTSSSELKMVVTKIRGFSMQKTILLLKPRRITSSYDLGTKATRVRVIINDHKQNLLAIHNKKNVDHHSNSSQNRGRNQPTKSHFYTGDKHHDGTNMGHNQGTETQSGEQIKLHKKQV
jgi:hypothetical protein